MGPLKKYVPCKIECFDLPSPISHFVTILFKPLHPMSFPEMWQTIEWQTRIFSYIFGYLCKPHYVKRGGKRSEITFFNYFPHSF